jgi:hypothetical protein
MAVTVTSVTPASGTTLGNTLVNIAGTGFVAPVVVTFDGIEATFNSNYTISPTLITLVRAPAHAAGPVTVRVTVPGGDWGEKSAAFTYEAPATIFVTGLSPSDGPVVGDVVRLAGSGFQPGCAVTFDGVPATDVVRVAAFAIHCRAPAHALGAVMARVTNPGSEYSEIGYTYSTRPSISISPDGGDFTADVPFTITASQTSTIYWSIFPNGEWQHQDNVTQVSGTLTKSGYVQFFAVDPTQQTTPVNRRYSRFHRRTFHVAKAGEPAAMVASLGFPLEVGNSLTDDPKWGACAGSAVPVMEGAENNFGDRWDVAIAAQGAPPPAAESAARWIGDAPHPDQWVVGANNPPLGGGSEFVCVRMNADGSGYGLAVGYDDSMGGGADMLVLWALNRFNADGTITQIAVPPTSSYYQQGDWYFHALEVWGEDPVHIRVLGMCPGNRDPDLLLGVDAGNEAYIDHDGDGYVDNVTPFPGGNGGLDVYQLFPKMWDPAYRRVVWEGTDNTPGQVRSGSQGVWLSNGFGYQLANLFGGQMFTARVLSQSGSTATIGGARRSGGAAVPEDITISGPAGISLGYTIITGNGWAIDVANLPAGPQTLVVSDGTGTINVAVEAQPDAVLVNASPASFALTVLSPTISLSLADRFKFPGPLKIWNGTTFVDAPFKSFDGITLS